MTNAQQKRGKLLESVDSKNAKTARRSFAMEVKF